MTSGIAIGLASMAEDLHFVEILVRLEVWNFEETRMVLVVLVCRHWLLTLKRADIWAGVLRFMGMYLFVFDSE